MKRRYPARCELGGIIVSAIEAMVSMDSANDDEQIIELTNEQRKLLLVCVERYRLLNILPSGQQEALDEIKWILEE